MMQHLHKVAIPGALVFFVAVVMLVAAGMAGDAREGNLADTDAYSWANRVVELREGGWFNETIDDVAPDGLTQHWSRPFDANRSVASANRNRFDIWDQESGHAESHRNTAWFIV